MNLSQIKLSPKKRTIQKKNVIAYCMLHKMVITKSRLGSRKCLKKNCRHLQKQNTEYFNQLAIQKLTLKAQKLKKIGDEKKLLKVMEKLNKLKGEGQLETT